jgi:hypothetical protein
VATFNRLDAGLTQAGSDTIIVRDSRTILPSQQPTTPFSNGCSRHRRLPGTSSDVVITIL